MPESAMLDDDNENESTTRRTFVKGAGAAAAAGALGGLAGCSSNNGNGGGDTSGDNNGGSKASMTVNFVSGMAAENSDIRSHYQKSMKDFTKKNGKVNVNLQAVSYGDIKTKLSSTVNAGNPPAIAEGGALGLKFYNQGKVPNHKPFFDKTDSLPDDLTSANKNSAQFRGKYWSGGAQRHTSSNLGINVQAFKKAGVTNPQKDLATWSQFYDYLEKIDKNQDITAWEETGVYNDLESYWGEARTAYTGGTDPWLRGNPKDPTIIVGSDHKDAPKTDGMIKNCIKLARKFSSNKSASRGDEEIPSLMLTNRVASFMYATPTANRWRQVKSDVKFGWKGGNGDIMLLPNPKLDPEYGAKVGIPELDGVSGEHGGHVWSLEQQTSIFDVSKKKQQAAWDLNVYMLTDKDFALPAWGKYYEAIPGTTSMGKKLLKNYGDKLPSWTTNAIDNVNKYGSQYATTGASWDVKGTSDIRWNNINKTISSSIAGQLSPQEVPKKINQNIKKTLKEQNK
jgi:ABC-type glycerol-3-phosphate transport system substrate-binding protein